MIKKKYLLINIGKNKMQEKKLIKETIKNIMKNKMNTSQILSIKNSKKNTSLINVKILSITNKKKLNKKNISLIKEKILIKKLKNKKEIGSAKRITKSKNKWTAYSNSMKLINCSIETNFKLTENVISTRYMIG